MLWKALVGENRGLFGYWFLFCLGSLHDSTFCTVFFFWCFPCSGRVVSGHVLCSCDRVRGKAERGNAWLEDRIYQLVELTIADLVSGVEGEH